MNSPPHFLLAGNGPYLNRGCEAIVRGTMAILRRTFGETFRVTLASFGPPDVIARQADCETDPLIEHVALRRPEALKPTPGTPGWWRMMLLRGCGRAFRLLGKPVQLYTPTQTSMPLSMLNGVVDSACCALQVGGDNYSLDYGVPLRFFLLDEYLWAHDVPVVLWGASVGPFDRAPLFALRAFEHLRKMRVIFVREDVSRDYLREHNVVNVARMSDPAFVMDPIEPSPAKLGVALPPSPLGLNFSPLMARYVTNGDHEHWTDLCVAMVESACRAVDAPLLLIPHVTVADSNDHSLLQAVAARVSPELRSRITCLNDNLSAAETKWVIGRCAAFAGARTHATIAALSTGVPTLSLAYSVKAKGLNRDVFGTLDYCMDPQALSPPAFANRLQTIHQQGDAIRAHLCRRLPVIREKAFQAGNELATLVTAGNACRRSNDKQ